MGEKPDYKTQLKEKLKQVDIADGVNKEEAIIIAQNYLIDNGLDNLLVISKPKIEEKHHYGDNYWCISFPTNSKVKWTQGLKWGVALVDKKTGKGEYTGEGPS